MDEGHIWPGMFPWGAQLFKRKKENASLRVYMSYRRTSWEGVWCFEKSCKVFLGK